MIQFNNVIFNIVVMETNVQQEMDENGNVDLIYRSDADGWAEEEDQDKIG